MKPLSTLISEACDVKEAANSYGTNDVRVAYFSDPDNKVYRIFKVEAAFVETGNRPRSDEP